ncbi:MAG: (Fe-S)-binding protein [Chloroflexota bacterium]
MEDRRQSLIEKYDLCKCFQCGKCLAGCPVSLKSVLNIRRLMREVMLSDNLGVVNQRPELWDCTTCQTCTIRCPRGLKPHELIVAMRANLIEEGRIPKTAGEALEGVFKHGNPWGRVRDKRAEWAAGMGIKNISQGERVDLLYFVCCSSSYDPRGQEVARALARSLLQAGVNFGILGSEESCCGSEVRRMGESGLFEMLVEDNLKLFHQYGITRVVTTSPHCYNVFKNEYQDKTIEARHYTQYVAELIQKGKLGFSREVRKRVTYHDPCYLGKQNRVFEEPRSIIKAIPGVTFVEFDRSRERSLCCEGGGGRMFVEAASDSGPRLAEIRVREAVEMGAEVLATACPFCLLNLEDAVKTTGNQEKIAVRDIMELVAEAL